MEQCEDIRHQRGMKELYQHRKETIERLFGIAKEYHNLRYTREKGKSKMEDKVGLTLACLNLKKLVKRMAGEPFYFVQMRWFKHGNSHCYLKIQIMYLRIHDFFVNWVQHNFAHLSVYFLVFFKTLTKNIIKIQKNIT